MSEEAEQKRKMEEQRKEMEMVQMAKKLDQAKAKLNVIKQVEAEEGGNFDLNVGPSLPGDGMNEYVENYIQTQSCDAPPTSDTPYRPLTQQWICMITGQEGLRCASGVPVEIPRKHQE